MKMPVEIRVSFIYDKETTPPLLVSTSRFVNWSNAGYELWRSLRHLTRAHAQLVEKLDGNDMRAHAKDIENALLGVDGIPFEPLVRNAGNNGTAIEATSSEGGK